VLGPYPVFSGVSSVSTCDAEGPGDKTMVKVQTILEALGLFSSKAEVSGPPEYTVIY
jgi:hypothetical protein